MSHATSRMVILAGLIAAVLLMTQGQHAAAHHSPGHGGGPGGESTEGPDPAGLVFYEDQELLYHYDTATGVSQSVGLAPGVYGEPSRRLHGGQRWFLASQVTNPSAFPDSSPQREIFAYGADGQQAQLTSHPAHLQVIGIETWSGDGIDVDASVSWAVTEWADLQGGDGVLDTVVGAGIYRGDLQWDVDGNIVGLAALPTSPAVVVGIQSPTESNPDLLHYSWSPDSTRAVYSTVGHNVWRVDDIDVAPGAPRSTHTDLGLDGYLLWWSPVGDSILSGDNGDVWTAAPDGSSYSTVLRGQTRISRKKTYKFHYPRGWSADGNHVLIDTLTGCYFGDPCTVPISTMRPDGSDLTEILAGGYLRSLGWVE